MQLKSLAVLLCLTACVTAYDDVNSLIIDATGKNAHDVLTEDDLDRIRDKVQRARLGDLERIYSFVDEQLRSRKIDAGITQAQREQYFENLRIVKMQILNPERIRRQQAARRELLHPGTPF